MGGTYKVACLACLTWFPLGCDIWEQSVTFELRMQTEWSQSQIFSASSNIFEIFSVLRPISLAAERLGDWASWEKEKEVSVCCCSHTTKFVIGGDNKTKTYVIYYYTLELPLYMSLNGLHIICARWNLSDIGHKKRNLNFPALWASLMILAFLLYCILFLFWDNAHRVCIRELTMSNLHCAACPVQWS